MKTSKKLDRSGRNLIYTIAMTQSIFGIEAKLQLLLLYLARFIKGESGSAWMMKCLEDTNGQVTDSIKKLNNVTVSQVNKTHKQPQKQPCKSAMTARKKKRRERRLAK